MTRMDKKKQIEELAKTICDICRQKTDCSNGQICTMAYIEAEGLYKADYRKQIGWISVDERMPEHKRWVLVWTRHIHHPVSCFYDYVWYFLGGFFSKDQVKYWMPLPEPPDTKGGGGEE